MNAGRVRALLAVSMTLAGSAAHAQDEGGARPKASGDRSVAAGAFAPWSMSARSDAQGALVHVQGGYDQARGGALFESVAEANVLGGLSVRAGASYIGGTGDVRPLVGAKLDLLRQERQGLDLAVAGAYEGHGFNMVPAVTFTAAVGGSVADTRLLANVGYAQGLELDERYGEARLGAFRRVIPRLHLGVDSRARLDLERNADEPSGEPDWEAVAGPAAALSLGRFVLTATGGASAVKFRAGGPTKVGALVATGVGAAF